MRALVRGVEEAGGRPSGGERMLLFLAVGASIISMILVFVVLYKLGLLEQAIKLVR